MSPLERFRYIRSLEMPTGPKVTLYTLAAHANKQDLCWPSRRLLMAETGMSWGGCYNALAWLRDHSLIAMQRRRGRANVVKLTLEIFQQLAQTPSPHDAPPRHQVTVEVDQLKRATRRPRRTRQELEAQQAADLNSVIHLFPEAKGK